MRRGSAPLTVLDQSNLVADRCWSHDREQSAPFADNRCKLRKPWGQWTNGQCATRALGSSAVACQRLEFELMAMSRSGWDVEKRGETMAGTQGDQEVLSEERSLEKERSERRWDDSRSVVDLMLRLLG